MKKALTLLAICFTLFAHAQDTTSYTIKYTWGYPLETTLNDSTRVLIGYDSAYTLHTRNTQLQYLKAYINTGIITGLTTNYLPIATSSTSLGNSWLYQGAIAAHSSHDFIIDSATNDLYTAICFQPNPTKRHVSMIGINRGDSGISMKIYGVKDSALFRFEPTHSGTLHPITFRENLTHPATLFASNMYANDTIATKLMLAPLLKISDTGGFVTSWDRLISYVGQHAGGFTAGGDLSGTSTSQQVIGLDNVPISGPATSDASFYVYNSGSKTFDPVKMTGGATMTSTGVVTVSGGGGLSAGDSLGGLSLITGSSQFLTNYSGIVNGGN